VLLRTLQLLRRHQLELVIHDHLRCFSDAMVVPSSKDEVRLLVLGSRKVGKTALIVRYLTRRFITEYANGMDSSYYRDMEVHGKAVQLKIIDFSGKTDPAEKIRSADGFVLVYSITSKRTLDKVLILKDYISHVKNHHRPYYISVVGNKSDLDHMREITNEYAKKRLNMRENNIFEVSAASSEHISTIQSIFEEMTSNIAVQKAIRPELIDRSLALEDKNSSEPKKKRTIRRKFRRRTSTL